VRRVGETEGVSFSTTFTVRLMAVVLFKPPEVPVIFTVAVPLAEPLAVSVSVLVLVVLDGLKDAFTPLGRPDTDKLTLPVKPFCGVTVIVLVPLEPWPIMTLPGDAESVKLGGAFTVRAIVVVWVKLPEVPVIVTVAGPMTAVPLALSVSVLVLVVLDGLKDAVTPFRRPDTDRLIWPLKPFCRVTVIVLVPLAPWTMLTLPGEAESV
jgi:hypothetical protein